MPDSWIDDLLGDEGVRPEFEADLRSRLVAAAGRPRGPRWLLPVAAALVVIAGAGTLVTFAVRRDTDRPVQVEPSIGPTSPPVVTSPASTTTSSTANSAPSTVPPTTGAPPSAAVAPLPATVAPEPSTSSVPATEPPASTEPPATTEATANQPVAAAGALDLQHGTAFDLSKSSFHDAGAAVDLISRSLGVPTSDTTKSGLYCPDDGPFRIVQWNDFVLIFGWSGDAEFLSSWQLGDPDQQIPTIDPIGPDLEPFPAGWITTFDDIGIGSPASALDGLSPIVLDPGQMVIVGAGADVGVTIRDGVIAGLWSGPWDWECGNEPR